MTFIYMYRLHTQCLMGYSVIFMYMYRLHNGSSISNLKNLHMIFRVVKTGNHWFKGARERQRDSVVVGGRKRDVGRER